MGFLFFNLEGQRYSLMKITDLRYLAAYIAPLTCFAGLYYGGWASPGSLYFSFMFVPLVELFVPASGHNDDEEVLKAKSGKLFFDILLYLNLPIVYGLVGYFVWLLGARDWGVFELFFFHSQCRFDHWGFWH